MNSNPRGRGLSQTRKEEAVSLESLQSRRLARKEKLKLWQEQKKKNYEAIHERYHRERILPFEETLRVYDYEYTPQPYGPHNNSHKENHSQKGNVKRTHSASNKENAHEKDVRYEEDNQVFRVPFRVRAANVSQSENMCEEGEKNLDNFKETQAQEESNEMTQDSMQVQPSLGEVQEQQVIQPEEQEIMQSEEQQMNIQLEEQQIAIQPEEHPMNTQPSEMNFEAPLPENSATQPSEEGVEEPIIEEKSIQQEEIVPEEKIGNPPELEAVHEESKEEVAEENSPTDPEASERIVEEVLEQGEKTEPSNRDSNKENIESQEEAQALPNLEELVEEVEQKNETDNEISAEELYIKGLEQRIDEIYEKSKESEVKAWRNDFKNCFRNPVDKRMMHINFKQVKPVSKDAVGERLIKNEKLWLLWFKIAGEICEMEEILDLFKEAIKLHLPNIRLLKAEFDAFFADFLNGTQLKSPSSEIQIESAQVPGNSERKDTSDHITEETEMRAHYRQVARALRSGEISGVGTPISSRSRGSRRNRSAKRKRGDFEKNQELSHEAGRRKEKIAKEQDGENQLSANAEQLIQLSDYTSVSTIPQDNANGAETLHLESTPVRKSPGLKSRSALVVDPCMNQDGQTFSKNKRLSVRFTDKVEEIDESGHVCHTEEVLVLQDQSGTQTRKLLERQQTPYSKSHDSEAPGHSEPSEESDLEQGFFLDPTKNIAFGFEKDMERHEKEESREECDENFILLEEKAFEGEQGQSLSPGRQMNIEIQMNGKYPYLKPRPTESSEKIGSEGKYITSNIFGDQQ